MTILVNTTQTPTVTANNITVELGPHETGDLLYVALSQDGGATAFAPDATALSNGWAMLAQDRVGTSARHGTAWKVAASGAEPNPTFTGSTQEWLATCTVYREQHASPFGSITNGTDYAVVTDAAGASHDSPALTTAVDGCLIVYSWGIDGPGSSMQAKNMLSDARCIDRQVNTTNVAIAQTISCVQQESAGAIPGAPLYVTSSGRPAVGIVVAIRNKSGGALQPDIRPSINEMYWYGNFGSQHDPAVTWEAPDQFAASIGGITCSSTTPTASVGNSSDTSANWGSYTSLTTGFNAGSGMWAGGTHAISSTDMTGKVFGLMYYSQSSMTDNTAGAEGWIVCFSDGTNWAAYQTRSKRNGWQYGSPEAAFIAPGVAEPYDSSGTVDWSAITRVGYFWHRTSTSTVNIQVGVKNAVLIDKVAITGGGPSRPAKFSDYARAMVGWNNIGLTDLQGGVQTLAKSSVELGDGGANTTYFYSGAESLAYPRAYGTGAADQMKWNAGDGAVAVTINAAAGDTVNLSDSGLVTQTNQDLTVVAGTNVSFSGQTVVGFDPTWLSGLPITAATFSSCGLADFKDADVSQVVFKDGRDDCYALVEDGASFTDCTFIAGGSAIYGVRVAAAGTITISGCTLTGFTYDFDVTAASGTVTIVKDAGDPTPTYQTAGATVVISSPTVERGQEFTGLVAGSFVRAVTSDDVTQKFEDLSSSTTETWDDATGGSVSVDYSIMQAGLVPIRVANVTLTGAVGSGVVTVPVDQVVDRGYAAASGLTINTNTYATVGTKKFGLTTGSTTQNWYSYLIEQWIALGNTGEAYANKDFPLESTGPTSFTAKDGWQFDLTTYPNSIANLSRGGLRYLDTSGNVTDVWAAILTTGVPASLTVRYKHQSTGAWSSASAADDMDELIKIIEDPNGDGSYVDGFDRSGTMIVRVQGEGYDMAEVDVVGTFGTLDNYLYSIAPVPTANGIATGNPTLNGSPAISVGTYSESGKTFGIKIVDGAGGNSGEDLLRWIRYAQGQGGTFQSREANDWHDLIQTNGTAFKTVRGTIYGPTAVKGVVIYQNDGVTLHPDFNLFTADDGTTYSPPVIANAVATVMADTRVQLYNVTQDAEIDNDFITGTSYSYTITTEADVGDTLRLRVTKKGRQSDEAFAVWAAAGVTFLVSQPEDTVYTSWGIDGETVTEYALDGANMQIDADDVDGGSQKIRLGAFYSYALTTEIGIRDFFGAVTAISPAAIRVNVDVATLRVQNINPTTPLRFTDIDVRLYCSDGSSIIAADSYSIHNDYSGVPDVTVVNVDGASVITGDIADIPSYVPSAAANAAATLAAAAATPIYADTRKMNGSDVLGNGTSGNMWRGE